MNETRESIYDEICRVLTEWETQEAVDDDLYWTLVKVQNNWETIITEEKSAGLTMSRIDNIKKFAQKKAEEKIDKEMEVIRQIKECKEKIKSFKPRIDGLIEVGNACLEHGIKLTGKAWDSYEGYDTHQFFTNSWSHLLGFVYDKNEINCLGIFGGGFCDYHLKTDGDFIEVEGRSVLYVLKRFVNEFDEFETEFYKYVDKVTAE